jgi:NTE family protein
MESNSFQEIINYLNDEELISRIKKLKNNKVNYSDVYSKENDEEFEYVNLVQEGGGTLGISLVGFCFVLEYLNIRFLRLAGTSAGAINTLFAAALGNTKNEAITPRLFQIIKNLDMFSFVDGHWIAKIIIKSIVNKDNWFISFLFAYGVILSLLIFYFPFVSRYSDDAYLFYILTFIVFIAITSVITYLLIRFRKSKYGVNPGKEFEKFLEKELNNVGIKTKNDLDKKACFSINKNGEVLQNNIKVDNLKFYYRPQINEETKYQNETILKTAKNFKKNENISFITQDKNIQFHEIKNHTELNVENNSLENLIADYTFISVDISSERKVEFPKHGKLYWENINQVNPAKFVRASMSIPVFFEPLILNINKDNESIKKSWNIIYVEQDEIPNQGIFIDGGSVSNFPMNIFHNPKIILPRLPVIGIRINDAPNHSKNEIKTFFNYAGKIINTMKSSYDKDFLLQNLFYEKYSIANIDTYKTKANWLDFSMSEENKYELFKKGVESALDFLENKFDWKKYKEERAKI